MGYRAKTFTVCRMSVRFEPGNFTVCGSEGVNLFISIADSCQYMHDDFGRKKITNRCAKSVYHSGEHVVTYTKTLCLFHCTKSIYHNGDQSLTLKPYVFFTAPRALILSQWAPKPCTLCLFYCTKCIYHTGDQNLTLKPYVFLRPTNWFVPELCRPSSCILCCPWTLCTHPIKDSDSSTGCPPEIQCLNNKMHF